MHGKTRYTIAFYLDGRRKRRMFTDLKEAKREAKLAAEKIQRGLQSNNDLRPAERDAFLVAQRILKGVDVPLVSAVEEYVRCRKVLGDVPLLAAVEEFARLTRGVKLGVSVPEVVEELIATKEQDGMSHRYLLQLRSILRTFAKAFPGPVMHVKRDEIDSWLRVNSGLSPVTHQEVFLSVTEARIVIAEWRPFYNRLHPHSRLGFQSPDDFARTMAQLEPVPGT